MHKITHCNCQVGGLRDDQRPFIDAFHKSCRILVCKKGLLCQCLPGMHPIVIFQMAFPVCSISTAVPRIPLSYLQPSCSDLYTLPSHGLFLRLTCMNTSSPSLSYPSIGLVLACVLSPLTWANPGCLLTFPISVQHYSTSVYGHQLLSKSSSVGIESTRVVKPCIPDMFASVVP